MYPGRKEQGGWLCLKKNLHRNFLEGNIRCDILLSFSTAKPSTPFPLGQLSVTVPYYIAATDKDNTYNAHRKTLYDFSSETRSFSPFFCLPRSREFRFSSFFLTTSRRKIKKKQKKKLKHRTTCLQPDDDRNPLRNESPIVSGNVLFNIIIIIIIIIRQYVVNYMYTVNYRLCADRSRPFAREIFLTKTSKILCNIIRCLL